MSYNAFMDGLGAKAKPMGPGSDRDWAIERRAAMTFKDEMAAIAQQELVESSAREVLAEISRIPGDPGDLEMFRFTLRMMAMRLVLKPREPDDG